MKLRLVLTTKTKKGKEVNIKFNIAPSKHIGFINFVNLVLSQGNEAKLTFEKISKTGAIEESKIEGKFSFEKIDENELKDLEDKIKDKEKQKKKTKQKRKSK